MTRTRCTLLHTPLRADWAARCPTGMNRFHFHGYDPREALNVHTGWRCCTHKHKSMAAAFDCTTRLLLAKEENT